MVRYEASCIDIKQAYNYGMQEEKKKERFEDYLRQVEEVVRNLESGKLGLEESLEKYEIGIHALRKCYEILQNAEKRLEMLMKDKDGTLRIQQYPASDEGNSTL
jgi:exodeoxyribonuclease VII small subunit